jgi:hypothetical protein
MDEARKAEINAPLAVDQPTAEVVDALSREPDLPHNMMMFMGSLTHTQSFSIQDLGGGPDYLVTETSPAHL